MSQSVRKANADILVSPRLHSRWKGILTQTHVYQFYWNKYIPNLAFQARGTLVAVSFECRSYICPSVSLTDSEREAPNEARPRHVLHVSEIDRENQLQESGKYAIPITL